MSGCRESGALRRGHVLISTTSGRKASGWLLALAVGSFAVTTDGTLVIGLLGRIASDVHSSPAATGQTVTVFGLAYAGAGPGFIALTRRWPQRRLLLAGLTVFVVSNVATAAASSLSTLLVARGVAGAAAGVVMPTAAAIASGAAPRGEQGRALGIVVGGASVAAVIGVPLGTLAGIYLSWRVAFLAVATIGLALVATLARRWPFERATAAPAKSPRQSPRSAGPTVVVTLLWASGSFTFFSYLTLVVNATAAVGGIGVAVYLVVFGIAGVLGALISGRATDAHRPAQVVAAALGVVAAAELGLALLATIATPHLTAVVGTGILIAIYSAGTWAVTPPQQHRLLATLPDNPRLLLSLNASALYTGVAIGTALGGAVISTAHSIVALCLGGAGFEIAALLVLAVSARPPQTPRETARPRRAIR